MSNKKSQDSAWEGLRISQPNAAGLDIGSEEIWAAVPPGRTDEPVRKFGTYTPDLKALADWLTTCGIDTVAMESTGVYRIPILEVLEARGLKVFLVNRWHLKHVPGRKSEVLDCQWIQQPHSLGLLRGSFRPDAEMCALRSLIRHRATLIEHRSPHILYLQKALLQMNLQLPAIISEVGTDMSRFPTEKHFCSWLGLVPHHEISGGKVLRNHTLKTDNRAGQAFRQAAACVIRSHSAFGAFYRRKRAQLGPMQAQVATAHKIARTVYHLLKFKTAYQDIGATAYQQKAQDREVAHLRKQAAQLGYVLTATTT